MYEDRAKLLVTTSTCETHGEIDPDCVAGIKLDENDSPKEYCGLCIVENIKNNNIKEIKIIEEELLS